MTRFYYAQHCPKGDITATRGDHLYRFASARERDSWVLAVPYDAENPGRVPLTREEAHRWYPDAFDRPATFPEVNPEGDYWDDDIPSLWSGRPTGGIYSEIDR